MLITGCGILSINSGYHDIGKFSTKNDAENGGIAYILKKYDSLPKEGYYKIKYSMTNRVPTERSPNSLWYNKNEAKLALELDIGSGTACKWSDVTKAVLEQALKSNTGLSKMDSLAKPDQPLGQCK